MKKKQIAGRTPKANKIINQFDTLVYKFGGFVEENQNPPNYDIDSVEFHTTYCYGSCPVFSIAMNNTGNTVYTAGTYNPKQGKFTAALKKNNFSDIIGLINYLSIKSLSDDYKVSWTDDQTCWLTVKFSDGTIKTIKDYGLKGTFGLRLLYSLFFDLRSNQDWKQAVP
ncbi:MAG TPA: DUF6438 domain-containing protein [Chitinophagaceae bacterium]|nr:DUF6438 domain-containing protein [Chitinophagaceae bacterium]